MLFHMETFVFTEHHGEKMFVVISKYKILTKFSFYNSSQCCLFRQHLLSSDIKISFSQGFDATNVHLKVNISISDFFFFKLTNNIVSPKKN